MPFTINPYPKQATEEGGEHWKGEGSRVKGQGKRSINLSKFTPMLQKKTKKTTKKNLATPAYYGMSIQMVKTSGLIARGIILKM